MASAKKTQYLDSLSIQDIYPRGQNNTTLPIDQILVTDGLGGTVWQSVSALTSGGAFTRINTTPSTIISRITNPEISFLNGPNAGLTVDPTAPNTLRLFANAFNQVTLEGNYSGDSIISAYDNPSDTYKSTISFVAGDNIVISGNSSANSLLFSAIPASNGMISTLSVLSTNMAALNASIAEDIAAFNSPYSAQPFIQYGSNILDRNGQSVVTFNELPNRKSYTNSNYAVQLTYIYKAGTSAIKPLSFTVNTSNNFIIYGDANSSISWTTYGQIF